MNKLLPFLLLPSIAFADNVSLYYENDSDHSYVQRTQYKYEDYFIGYAWTTNKVSPYIGIYDFGVYFNKAPYLFFDKSYEYNNYTFHVFLDSVDYEHTSKYNDDLWYGGVGVSSDISLSEKSTLGYFISGRYLSDDNVRSLIKLKYSWNVVPEANFIVKYKNALSKFDSEYYYSPERYNSIEIGANRSYTIADTFLRVELTAGPYETEYDSGITSSIDVLWKLSRTINIRTHFTLENDYKYGNINFSYSF